METTGNKLSVSIKNTEHLYDILSKAYYLPKLNCRCVTKEYLLEYIKKDIPIFTMKKEKVVHHYFRKSLKPCRELLEILEKLLISKKKPPTGISPDQPPNKEWLLNAILRVDPNDPEKLLAPQVNESLDYKIEVNPEYISFK